MANPSGGPAPRSAPPRALIPVLTALLGAMLLAGHLLTPRVQASADKGGKLAVSPAPVQRKVIVLGFDGADPKLCERWMNEFDPATGKPYLENLAALRDEGAFARMRTTFPAQTPVAWACAACGVNPGGTGIADFVGRDPKTMTPYLTLVGKEDRPLGLAPMWRWAAALLAGLLTIPAWLLVFGAWSTREGAKAPVKRRAAGATLGLLLGAALGYALTAWIPATLPVAKNLRRGTTLWKAAGAYGARTVLLKFPLTFPAESEPGLRMLAGFGVPDVNRTVYSWTLFDPNAKEEERTETYGTIRPWQADAEGRWLSYIEGPVNPLYSESAEAERLRVEAAFHGGKLSLGGAEPQAVAAGEWTDFFRFEIAFSPLVKLRVMARAALLEVKDGAPKVLVGPLQFDPEAPPPNVPLSVPRAFAGDLAREAGVYPTVGWDIATHPAKDGVLSDAGFVKDLRYAEARDGALFQHELARGDWDLLCAIFMATDRAGHILWKHLSANHPLHDPAQAEAGIAELRRSYRWMDGVVGQARVRAKELDAELLVLSDHGFAAFDHQVNLNSALRDAGLLKLKQESLPADARQAVSGENFNRIDFSGTFAYAVGLGGIYLNLEGREAAGVVKEAERDAIAARVIEVLKKIADPKTGKPVVRRIERNEDVYRGPMAGNLPDLLVCFEPGYRVSWATVVGGAPGPVLEPNRSDWSGDHCSVDPDEVPGIFFATRKMGEGGEPALVDLAPTVLQLLGLPVPPEAGWEGRALWPANAP